MTWVVLIGSFALAIAALAVAGRFARQTRRPMGSGALPKDSLLSASVIVGTALILVALTCLPALTLGPVIEHPRLLTTG